MDDDEERSRSVATTQRCATVSQRKVDFSVGANSSNDFKSAIFLTVAVTVGTVDEAGTRAQNQDLTRSIND
jgi:hypothetical protein